MKIKLIYKKGLSNSKKKIEFDTDKPSSRSNLILILEHEKNKRAVSTILGKLMDFKDDYQLSIIKVDGKKVSRSELFTMLGKEETKNLKLSKKMKKRMGMK